MYDEKRNIIIAGIIILAVVVITVLCVKYLEFAPKEGIIVRRVYDPEHITYREDRDSVYRKEYYTNADGERDYRNVFDHYEYAIYEEFDGEDYIIVIEAPSKKIEGKVLTNTFYVTPYRYENVSVGNNFIFGPEEHGDKNYEGNNRNKRVTSWSRWQHDMREWRSKEY